MIHIAICYTNGNMLEVIYQRTIDFIHDQKIPVMIHNYNKGALLLYDIQENVHYDLILLDVEMSDINGITLVHQIKQLLPNILIIFITSQLKYAVDAFELSVFRYIPIIWLNQRFKNALADAFQMIQLQSNDYYVIQTQNRMVKILYKDIIYIKKDGKNSVFITNHNKTTKVRKSLWKVYNELMCKDFTYIDRGCIINITHVLEMKNYEIFLKNGLALQISRSHVEEFKKLLNHFWLESE